MGTHTCSRCGAPFGEPTRSPHSKALCPYCLQTPGFGGLWMLLALIGLVSIWIGQSLTSIGVTMLVGLGTMVIATVSHELAHAVAARLTGLGLTAIRIGAPPWLVRTVVGGVRVEVGAMPLVGHVVPGPTRPLEGLRWRWATVVLAGPMANLALVITGLVLGVGPLSWWVIWNALIVALTLYPSGKDGGMVSDGRHLVAAMRNDRKVLDAVLITGAASRVEHFDIAGARRAWDAVPPAHRDSLPAVATEAALLTIEGRAEEGWTRIRPLLDGLDQRSDPERAVLTNTAAWIGLTSPDPAIVEWSIGAIQDALRTTPWDPGIASTAAVAAAMDGADTEAARLVNQVRAALDDQHPGLAEADVAEGMIAARHGDLVGAVRLADVARERNRHLPLLDRLDGMLRASEPESTAG